MLSGTRTQQQSMTTITLRALQENELDKIRQINRAEDIQEVYAYHQGSLVLKQQPESVAHFDPAELEEMIGKQVILLREGGQVIGAFHSEILVGAVSVEQKKRGELLHYCKMDMLYVSKDFRGFQIGRRLLEAGKEAARSFGAAKLYISATPTKNTIDFYLNNGAILTTELDKALFSAEPLDIHLEMLT